jgi:hypothetical protein
MNKLGSQILNQEEINKKNKKNNIKKSWITIVIPTSVSEQ